MAIKPMGVQQWGMLILLSILWGGSFFFMKLALDELPVFSIVFVRVSLGALCLYFFLRISGTKIPSQWLQWRLFFYLGIFNNIIPFSLLIYGMSEIASALAAILNATTPLFTIVVAHFYTSDEKITPAKVSGILLGVLGVGVLVGVDVLDADNSLLAILACLGAALSYAVAAMFGRQFKQLAIGPTAGAFGQVCASSVLLIPLVFMFESPLQIPIPSQEIIAALLALGILSTALAYVLFFKLIETAGATNAVLVTLLVPVSASGLGVILLNEQITSQQLLGMALIGAGLIAIDGRLFNRLFRRS